MKANSHQEIQSISDRVIAMVDPAKTQNKLVLKHILPKTQVEELLEKIAIPAPLLFSRYPLMNQVSEIDVTPKLQFGLTLDGN